jgi:hypothetical protein
MSQSDNASKITFVQHSVPKLQGGKYTVTATQTINYKDKTKFSLAKYEEKEEKYSATRKFYVNYPRFTLTPGVVKSVFPPRNAAGNFGLTLPHIVLMQETLPWAWTLGSTGSTRDTRADSDVAPWLALLVFTVDDGIPEIANRQLKDLEKQPDGGCSYPGMQVNAPAEAGDTPINTIDIPVQLFNQIAPTSEDIKYLAHVRYVSPASRAQKSSDLENRKEAYSVVVANRLPSSERTVVHLVSLIGMKSYLPTQTGSSNLLSGKKFVRLVSLDSWEFITQKPTQDFKFLVANTLVTDTASRKDPSTLRLPGTPVSGTQTSEDQAVEKALAMGYVALNHQTRLGDETVSWYRGPFVPYSTSEVVKLPAFGADALIRYDPETGLFDESYAAAWQLGRLMTLRNKEIAVALHNWKIGNLTEDIRQYKQRQIQASLGEDLADLSAKSRNRSQEGQAATALTEALLELLADKADVVLNNDVSVSQSARSLEIEESEESEETGASEAEGFPVIEPDDLLSHLMDQNPAARSRQTSPSAELPEAIQSWLGELELLRGVPYSYLVPDERMLPPESLRFFHLDRNWIKCLRDGALSIGRTTESVLAQDRRHLDYFEQAAVEISVQDRARLLDLPDEMTARNLPEGNNITGFLFHSQVVADYPGLEIQGFSDTNDNPSKITILHFEKLAPTVLLCLFEGVVNQVRFLLPSEGVNFGVDQNKDQQFCKTPLRQLNTPFGLVKDKEVLIPFRGDKRVIQVNELANRLKNTLGINSFTSAEFAFEMADEGPIVIFWTKEKPLSAQIARSAFASRSITASTFLPPELLERLESGELLPEGESYPVSLTMTGTLTVASQPDNGEHAVTLTFTNSDLTVLPSEPTETES